MARQIVVDIIGDASKFNRAADGAVQKANTLGGRLRGIGTGIKLGVGIGAFNLLDSAISSVIGSLGEMDQAFRDDQVSQKLLATALKNNIPNWTGNTKAVEKYAAAQAKLGFSDDEVRDSIGQLIGITHDLTKAQELNSLAQELARAKGIDLATASDVITKALQGNSRALKAYGIDTAGAADATEILDRIYQNVKGSAEAYAQTSEGKLTVSQVKVQEAMEKIGAVVDKIAVVVLPALADAFTTVADVVTTVWPAISTAISLAASVIVPAINLIISVVKALISVTQTAIGLVNTLIGNNDKLAAQRAQYEAAGVFGFNPFGIFGSGGRDIRQRAAGGPVLSGVSYLVGEHGPEILQMGRSSGSIIPNGKWGDGGSSSMVFNFNGPVFGDGPFLDDLTNRIAQRLRYASGR